MVEKKQENGRNLFQGTAAGEKEDAENKAPAAETNEKEDSDSFSDADVMTRTPTYHDPPDLLNARVNAVGRLLANESPNSAFLRERQLLPDQNSHKVYTNSQVSLVIQACFEEMVRAARRLGEKEHAVIPSPAAIKTVGHLLVSQRYGQRWPQNVKTCLHTKLTNRKHYFVRELKKESKKKTSAACTQSNASLPLHTKADDTKGKSPLNKNRRQLNCFPAAGHTFATMISPVRPQSFDAACARSCPPLRRNLFGMMIPQQVTCPDITAVSDYFVSRNPDRSINTEDVEIYCKNFPYLHRFLEVNDIPTILKTPAVPFLTSTVLYDIHFAVSIDTKLSFGVLEPFKQRLAAYVPHIESLFGTTPAVGRNLVTRLAEGNTGCSMPPEFQILNLVAQYFEETTEAFMFMPLCPTGVGPYNAMAKCSVPHVIIGEYAQNKVQKYKVYVSGEMLKETDDASTAIFFWLTSWYILNSQTERFPRNPLAESPATSTKTVPVTAGNKSKPPGGGEEKKKEKVIRLAVTNTVYFFAHYFLAVWNNHDSSVKPKDRSKIESLISRFSKLQTRMTLSREKNDRSENDTALSFM